MRLQWCIYDGYGIFCMNQVVAANCQLTDLVIPRIGFGLEKGPKELLEGWDVKYLSPIFSWKQKQILAIGVRNLHIISYHSYHSQSLYSGQGARVAPHLPRPRLLWLLQWKILHHKKTGRISQVQAIWPHQLLKWLFQTEQKVNLYADDALKVSVGDSLARLQCLHALDQAV